MNRQQGFLPRNELAQDYIPVTLSLERLSEFPFATQDIRQCLAAISAAALDFASLTQCAADDRRALEH